MASQLPLRKYWRCPVLAQEWNEEQRDRSSSWTEVTNASEIREAPHRAATIAQRGAASPPSRRLRSRPFAADSCRLGLHTPTPFSSTINSQLLYPGTSQQLTDRPTDASPPIRSPAIHVRERSSSSTCSWWEQSQTRCTCSWHLPPGGALGTSCCTLGSSTSYGPPTCAWLGGLGGRGVRGVCGWV